MERARGGLVESPTRDTVLKSLTRRTKLLLLKERLPKRILVNKRDVKLLADLLLVEKLLTDLLLLVRKVHNQKEDEGGLR